MTGKERRFTPVSNIQPQKALTYDINSCTGCRYCEIACSSKHGGFYGRNSSRIRIITDDRELLNTAVFCHHCENPACVDLCPVGAIARNEETALVSIDANKCTGCRLCIECPLEGIRMDEQAGVALNCDLCQGSPECAKFCPTHALQYVLPETHGNKKLTGD